MVLFAYSHFYTMPGCSSFLYDDDDEELVMKPKIVIKVFQEQKIGYFDISLLISQSEESFYRPLTEKSEPFLKKVGKPGSLIVREVIKIPGVTKVYIGSYQMSVQISKAHDWVPVEKRVIKIISNQVFHGREPAVIYNNI